ncbi:MAG: G1 family endopeptidase [Actinomycetota bacterium]|nr:G1 family endopeptidase [Actinomycetota bacterium]
MHPVRAQFAGALLVGTVGVGLAVPGPRSHHLARPAARSAPGAIAMPAITMPAVTEAAPSEFYPATGFGGYRTTAKVGAISARWTVPAIAPTSRAGFAATWIGAQGSPSAGPFVQVGTIEFKQPGDAPMYLLFWSDVQAGFSAQPMGGVAPGDVVDVSMRRLASGGWRLVVRDETSGAVASKSLSYGKGGAFNQAEWLQEDPAPAQVTPVDLPYPRLSTVTFSRLMVNGVPPALGRGDGQTLMTLHGGTFVPTAVSSDSFSLLRPTGVPARYLSYAGSLDRVLSTFEAALALWPRLPSALRAKVAGDLVRAYGRSRQRFAAFSWPSGAQRAIAALIHQNHVAEVALKRWISSGMAIGSPAYERMIRSMRSGVGGVARQALGLPPA